MTATPATIGELFRSLGPHAHDPRRGGRGDAWACTLTRPDGQTYEIESVSFFDVDPDTGDEWIVEPGPSRVLSVLAGGDVEDEDGAEAGEDAEAAARASWATRPTSCSTSWTPTGLE